MNKNIIHHMRFWRITSVVLFIVILTVPLLTFQEPGHITLLENKVTASKPRLSDYSIGDRRLPRAWDEYFEDNIGLKDEAVVAHISAMYRLFKKVVVPNYVQGKKGHLFYLTDNILKDYQGLSALDPTQKKVMAEILTQLDRAVQTYGSTFIFMPIPNKETIYSEYVEDDIRVLGDETMLGGLSDYLRQNTKVRVVDVEGALRTAKEDGDELLYYKNRDVTHWNLYGASIGYQALMDVIQSVDPKQPRIWPDEIEVQHVDVNTPIAFLSTQSAMVKAAYSDLWDLEYSLNLKDGWHGVSDPSVPAGFSQAYDPSALYYHFHNPTRNGPSLAVFGDSYIYDFQFPLLSESFSDIYFLPYQIPETVIAELLSKINPKYIVFETVARAIDYSALSRYSIALRNAVMTGCYIKCSEYGEADAFPLDDGDYAIHFDNESAERDRILKLADYGSDAEVTLSGWEADLTRNSEMGMIMVKAGDRYFIASQVKRMDLPDEYHMSGFIVTIPTEAISGEDAIEIITLNKDFDASFPAVELEIES